MQAPKRKSEQYAVVLVDYHVTQEKFNALAVKLERLRKIRPALAAEVGRLGAMGDFSENAPYQIAKGRLRSINARIEETENLLKKAVIIKQKKSDRVELGNVVVVNASGKEKTYQILGSQETDPERGIISHNSPIGSALLGKKAGEEVLIKIGTGEIRYKILEVK